MSGPRSRKVGQPVSVPSAVNTIVKTCVGPVEVVIVGEGKKSALVFISHGLGDCSSLRQIALQLVAASPELSVVTWSRPGCGLSPCSDPSLSDPLFYEASVVLPALMNALGIPAAHFLAHADGASVALMFAGLFPKRTLGIVALAPYGFADAHLRAAVEAMPIDEIDSEVSEQLVGRHPDPVLVFQRWRRQRISEIDRRWSGLSHFSSVSAPLTIVQGARDEFSSLDQTATIAGSVAGQVNWVTLRNTGHSLHYEVPEQVTALVLSHLRCFDALLELPASSRGTLAAVA